jgi:DNA-binding XRE family transcriptional regulator
MKSKTSIRKAMKRLSITHQEMADRIGVKRVSVTRWLAGHIVSAPMDKAAGRVIEAAVKAVYVREWRGKR